MARTALVVQNPRTTNGITGLTTVEVAGDAAADVGFPNDGQTILLVRNGGAGAHVLTFDTPGTVEGQAIGNPSAPSLGAGLWGCYGPFPRATFNQDDGMVYVSSDGTKTECKYVAIRVTPQG